MNANGKMNANSSVLAYPDSASDLETQASALADASQDSASALADANQGSGLVLADAGQGFDKISFIDH